MAKKIVHCLGGARAGSGAAGGIIANFTLPE
jgi:hypothetical protein